ncbi:methyltransferase [Salinicola avicenniae]|uniref:methyltransferase n=1 Tax=Salinicola avicenniae TaxID=2916836 RepID=UPI002073C0E6|nr:MULTISPECIES: methyltransferase [unclassified Salinicola]
MTPQTPPCELLARQDADYRGWLWVAPPRDGWLESGEGAVWSADLSVCAAWAAAGRPAHSSLVPPTFAVPGAVLFWPKSHALGAWWLEALCGALPAGTPIQVVGETQGGIRRVPKTLAAMALACRKLDNARRCTLFETRADDRATVPDTGWTSFEVAVAGVDGLTLATHPGVFGHGKLDDGTRLLLQALVDSPLATQGEALDIGCGDGIISAWLARRGWQVTASDISAFAVEAARRSLAANGLRGQVCQSDVYDGVDGVFQAIVSNPPFHQERAIDYDPTERLIREAPARLQAGGSLTLVANAFLPYPDWLTAAFGSFEVLADDRRFRVYRAFKRRR